MTDDKVWLGTRDGVCVGVCDHIMAHSLSLRKSFFPMFSSELDSDRELMKGDVDG